MHTVWTDDQKFEIVKDSAAPEKYSRNILKVLGGEFNICELAHPGSDSFN